MTSPQTLSFHLRSWVAWTPGNAPTGPVPPALLRRRVSPLGQEALRAAWGLPNASSSRVIVSSRHGEFGRTLSILDRLVAGIEVSPADFTLSVHNALVGLLSIANSNQQGHIAVAAGPESFCFGLLEALATLADKPAEPVVLLHYDEPLPEPFAIFNEGSAPPEVLCLVLASDGEPFDLTIAPAAGNPAIAASPASTFQHFLQEPNTIEGIFQGQRCDWRWRRHTKVT